MEAFMGWYSGNKFDSFLLWNRLHGPYAFWYLGIADLQHRHSAGTGFPEDAYQSTVALAHLFSRPDRHVARAFHYRGGQLAARFRYVLLGMYYPTKWDWMTYIGTMGMFLAAIFLFVRILPMISIFEMRTLLPEAEVKE